MNTCFSSYMLELGVGASHIFVLGNARYIKGMQGRRTSEGVSSLATSCDHFTDKYHLKMMSEMTSHDRLGSHSRGYRQASCLSALASPQGNRSSVGTTTRAGDRGVVPKQL